VGLDDTYNSYLTWTNPSGLAGGYGFQITSIQLIAKDAVGTDPNLPPEQGGNQVEQEQGQGVISTWEQSDAIRNGERMSDVRAQITIRPNAANEYAWDLSGSVEDPSGSGNYVANNQLVTVDPVLSTPGNTYPLYQPATWFGESYGYPSTTTWDTPVGPSDPVDRSPGLFNATGTLGDNSIDPGQSVEIRIFQPQYPANVTDVDPVAILSNVTIQIYGETADLSGSEHDFGYVRVYAGAGTATASATVTNNGGYRASNVTPLAASGVFSGGGINLGEIVAGGHGDFSVGFDPTAISTTQLSQQIQVESSDALGTSYTLTGYGVGPEINANYNGIDYNDSKDGIHQGIDDIVINFGNQGIDDGPTDPAKTLTFTNIFGLYDALNADPTSLTIQLSWSDGFRLWYDGDEQFGDLTIGDILSDSNLLAPVQIRFDPSHEGLYSGTLSILTDQGDQYGVVGGTGSSYSIALTGVGTTNGNDAPLPGTLTLLGLGLASLRLRRWGSAINQRNH